MLAEKNKPMRRPRKNNSVTAKWKRENGMDKTDGLSTWKKRSEIIAQKERRKGQSSGKQCGSSSK